ncbi:MAG: radical SAM protein, partial [Nitrospira sp.]|nr:radical SAM protein [Nitrospira sp.]
GSNMLRQQNLLLNRQEIMEGKIVLESKPLTLDVAVTNDCDIDCIMCFTKYMSHHDMSSEVFESVRQMFPYPMEIRWNDAGEILATKNPEYYLDIINEIRPPKSYVSTNLLTADKYIEKIVAGGLTHISVSMDAATPQTYRSIRVGSNFERVVNNLKLVKAFKEQKKTEIPYITLVFVAMKKNIHELPLFVELAHEVGAREIHVLRLLTAPTGVQLYQVLDPAIEKHWYRVAKKRADELDVKLYHIAWTDEELLRDPEGVGAGLVLPLHPWQLDPRYRTIQRQIAEARIHETPFCRSPWQEMLVDVDGNVRPCCFMPNIMGNVKEDSPEKIWNNENYQNLRRKLLNHDLSECKQCGIVAKVFTSYEPLYPDAETTPIEIRLNSLKEMYKLEKDYTPQSPWSHPTPLILKLGNLPLTLNTRWQLLPEDRKGSPGLEKSNTLPDELGGAVTTMKQSQAPDFNYEIQSHRHFLGRFIVFAKKLLFRPIRAYLEHILRNQQLFNLQVTQFCDLMLRRQREFNATVVKYLNNLSEYTGKSLERQIDYNGDALRALNLLTRQESELDRSLQILLESSTDYWYCLWNNLGDQMAKSYDQSMPLRRAEEIFYRVEYLNHGTPKEMEAGKTYSIPLTFKNTSFSPWFRNGSNAVQCSYQWFNAEDGSLVSEGIRTLLPQDVLPIQEITVSAKLTAPEKSGNYLLKWDLLLGNQIWFHQYTQQTLDIKVCVK